MAITRAIHIFPPTTRGAPALILGQLSRYQRERVTGVESDTFTLFNEPVEPWQLEMNGRTLDRDSTPPEYVVTDKTVTLSRAAVATDVFLFSSHFRTA
jgi:hypothetical protein